jgi:alpha-tubulin suppressor-like RCC1 family protein
MVDINAGVKYTVALKSDGTVWTWGQNTNGQLGDGTKTNKSSPIQVSGLTGIIAVEAEAYTSLALKSDGTVWGWGQNDKGQLGDGATKDSATPVQVMGLIGVSAISAGVGHSLALKSDGTVWAWGQNTNGQLGDGTTQNRLTPVQVGGINGMTAVCAGLTPGHSLALKSDGTVWAWGNNTDGQLGDGTKTERHTPVQVAGLSGITAVVAARQYSLALKIRWHRVGLG